MSRLTDFMIYKINADAVRNCNYSCPDCGETDLLTGGNRIIGWSDKENVWGNSGIGVVCECCKCFCKYIIHQREDTLIDILKEEIEHGLKPWGKVE